MISPPGGLPGSNSTLYLEVAVVRLCGHSRACGVAEDPFLRRGTWIPPPGCESRRIFTGMELERSSRGRGKDPLPLRLRTKLSTV